MLIQACVSWQDGEQTMRAHAMLMYNRYESVLVNGGFQDTSSYVASFFKDTGYFDNYNQMCRTDRPDGC